LGEVVGFLMLFTGVAVARELLGYEEGKRLTGGGQVVEIIYSCGSHQPEESTKLL
jgi:hypothetical protein